MIEPSMGHAMQATYDLRAVVVSIVIASIAAYAALSMGERVTESRGIARILWLGGGSIAMGVGIWSMHFIGMLAFQLPIAIGYDFATVALSLLAAIAASGVALTVVSRPTMTRRTWLAGGSVMGGGIASMHYTGMGAMRLAASVRYDAAIVVASIAIAIAVSLVALRLVFALRVWSHRALDPRRFLAATVMGLAVAGMHYTGMAAATFSATAMPPVGSDVLTSQTLGGIVIAFGTALVLVLAIAVAYVDRRFSAHHVALVESTNRFHAVVGNTGLLFVLDANGIVTMAQGRELARIGANSGQSVGRSFFELFESVAAWADQAHRGLAGEAFTAVSELAGLTIEMRWTPLRGEGDAIAGLIAVGTDITARRRSEAELTYRASHDTLTGLPNRAALDERLNRMLENARVTHVPVGLALVDLNGFKKVNDSLGHVAGDALLREVAVRLASAVRESDFVARIGGDEFGILVGGGNVSDLRDVARRLGNVLVPGFSISGTELRVGASIGLARVPQHATDAVGLLRCADSAMYAAKRNGEAYVLFDSARIVESQQA